MPPREFSGGGAMGASSPSPPKPDKDKGKGLLEVDLVSSDGSATPSTLAAPRELAKPPHEFSGGGGGSDGSATPSPLASPRELAKPPHEFSGGGGGSGSGSKPDKGKALLEVDQLDEDMALKERVELCLLMLQDTDPHVQEHALNTLRHDIHSLRSARNSVPKPIKFLVPHYETLKACYATMDKFVLKKKMDEILLLVDSTVERTVPLMNIVGQGEEESKEVDAANPWADLPYDLIIAVVASLPLCRAERQGVTNVNRYWRRVIKLELPLPTALPWLLMPSSTSPLFHTSRSDGRWHRFNATEDFKQHARICGSADGGWAVILLVEPQRHQLFNFNTRDFHPLPLNMLLNGELRAVTLKSAVLSGSPVTAYTIAALVELQDASTVCLVLGNHRSLHWEYVASFAEDFIIQDLLYYKDALYLLTSDEGLVKLVIKDNQSHLINLHVTERPGYEIDMMMHTMQRYLCESEGSLFMIVKFLNNITLEIRAFQLEVDPVVLLPHWDGDDPLVDLDRQASWVDVSESKHLEGRLFFVGQASSRSFNSNGTGRIHFLDDRHAQVAPQEYLRDDMGTVSFDDVMMIVNFPPVGDEPLPPPTSDRDPPAWWLP